jgi:hypothetical protein
MLALTSCSTARHTGEGEVKPNPSNGNSVTQPVEQDPPAAISIKELAFNGVSIGIPVTEAKKVLGEPTGKDYVQGIGADVLVYESLGLRVFFDRNTELVTGWSTDSPSFKTSRGVGIGSTKADVLKAYGEPRSHDAEGEQLFYRQPTDMDLRLGFEFFEGKVRRIGAGGSPFVW